MLDTTVAGYPNWIFWAYRLYGRHSVASSGLQTGVNPTNGEEMF